MSVPVEMSAVRFSSSSTSAGESSTGATGLQDVGEVQVVRVAAEAHRQDGLGVLQGVQHDLLHLGEVPAVPLLHAHRVDVDLLVQLVQKTDRLDHHRVHLVCAELQLVTTMGRGNITHRPRL